ncbi:MAG: hypothetical protein P4L38_12680 [Syntrophaceae bacterium]|nr:hypothetical protein [Syntrophaceae bacterium]
MNQGVQDILAISFACPTTTEEGDVVKISGDNAVVKNTDIGSVNVVGVVCAHIPGAAACTVATRFRERRDDRLAGVTVTPGAFVWGPLNRVYPYSGASCASVTGANAGTFAIVADTSDVVGLKIGGDEKQTFTLTAGAARTAIQVAGEINATATGFVVTVNTDGKLVFTALNVNQSLEITAETHTANTVLGLTAGVVLGGSSTHDPSAVAGLIIKGASAGSAIETLEY